MRYHLFLASAVILGLGLTSGAMADGDDRGVGQRAFVGLWQGIDSFDGSTQLVSITCSSRKTCDVRLNDTAFTLSCPINELGFAEGLGSINRNVLTVDLTLTCSNSGVVFGPQLNEFVLDRKNGTLTNLNSDNDNDPEPVDNVFHRISK
jgi:hypothetical protein